MITHAEEILANRYAAFDGETKEEMFGRVAEVLASVEKHDKSKWEAKFFEVMTDGHFIPGGRILAAAVPGGDNKYCTNCYVLGVDDNLVSIGETLSRAAILAAAGGGVGINFSKLRPRGAKVSRSRGVSSGPCSFIDVHDAYAKTIIQGGSRRSANMAILNVDHPDIEEFITAKKVAGRWRHFNVSVGITDAFVNAVVSDFTWALTFEGKVYKTVKARDLFDLIVQSAWGSAEPGLFNIDRINEDNNLQYIENLDTANACAELPMPVYKNNFGGICVLGAVNLCSFVDGAAYMGDETSFDYSRMEDTIRVGVRMLDNVLDAQDYVFPEIKLIAQLPRRIGLGVMGLGDALIKLGVKYSDSEDVVRDIASEFQRFAYEASIELAQEKGPFEQYVHDRFVNTPHIQRLRERFPDLVTDIGRYGIRNGVITSLQPTGTTSIFAGTTSGIEPVFAWKTKRKDEMGVRILAHPFVDEYASQFGDERKLPDYFQKAHDISPEEHLNMQLVWQEYICSAASKTVNCPKDTTIDQIKQLYMEALTAEFPVKGITIYRSDSRSEEVLTSVENDEDNTRLEARQVSQKESSIETNGNHYVPIKISDNDDIRNGVRLRVQSSMGSGYMFVSYNEHGEPVEIFSLVDQDVAYPEMAEALCRQISISLRGGVPVSKVIVQLEKSMRKAEMGSLVPRISHALKMARQIGINNNVDILMVEAGICPQCNSYTLVEQGGCSKCRSCNYSDCV